ncbi:beta-glucosidase [Sinomonas terrae]|uniref:Glycoside hydrolase family 3 C-terminal domain-containing protein n=1 Tax=Sinomonas terrae TaxID=2908838 RepID=A0ABS9TWH8_9MICC|nr:glycoside hydrolase family 3 C-terminal domain-containing protein [Sinomonas terrae]MCH6468774.1 glycoside hydrolase family 3 C-terminal domain-containing protein [Sinomonas terrae]
MTDILDERESRKQPSEADLRERIGCLNLEEKVRLLTGSSFWSIEAEPKAGLRRFVVSDGPVGVRGETWDDRDWSANGPSPTAIAATWDPELVERIGHAMGAEARRKGVDVILAPTVNLHRTPVGGRHFECFSEDPLLTGAIAAAWVRGVQGQGVGTCVKHFVANDQETERMGVDNIVDERTLRELYLAPFEHIEREAKPWSYMAAYNKVNGTAMTESPLLDDVLKGEWGSDALVMSDWFATRSTIESANAGLDLAMPGPVSPWGQALVDAVRAGDVDETKVDEKLLRLFRLAARTGAVEGFEGREAQPVSEEEMDDLLREAAAAGFVLVKNDSVLPLPDVTSLAVVGPNAVRGRVAGGGSASVMPKHVVHPAEALAAALPNAKVRTALGVRSTERVGVLEGAAAQLPDGSGEGLLVEFLDAEGKVLGSEQRRIGQFVWMGDFAPGIPADRVATVRTTTRVTAAQPGTHRFGASGVGRITVALDGDILADEDVRLREGADIVEALMLPPQLLVERELAEGESILLATTFAAVADPTTGAHFWATLVNLEEPHGTDDEEMAAAVELARSSNAAVVVVGTTEEVESEGYDRESLGLPGRQDELIEAVIDANPNTVVVVNAGAPVLMPWLAKAKAVLLVWFPGQQMGAALADVLTGAVEPGGHLPTTWPAPGGIVQPENVPVKGTVGYEEGLDVGYKAYLRREIQPAVPFGHGLGYTTWSLSNPETAGDAVNVSVTNTGHRAGAHVVQVYVSRPDSALERPAAWLAAFAKVTLEPGETRRVEIPIPARAFEHWDAEGHSWTVEPGEFVVEVGPSIAERTRAGSVVR